MHKNAWRRPGPNKEASSSEEKDQYDRKNGAFQPILCSLPPLTAGRWIRADIVYSTLPLLCLSTRSSPRRPRRVRTCGRGIRGTWCMRGIRGRGYTLPEGKRERMSGEGELHSRWSLLFSLERGKEAATRERRRLRRHYAASTKKSALEEEGLDEHRLSRHTVFFFASAN